MNVDYLDKLFNPAEWVESGSKMNDNLISACNERGRINQSKTGARNLTATF